MSERERGKKKEEEEESPEKPTLLWPGFEPTDSVSRAERAKGSDLGSEVSQSFHSESKAAEINAKSVYTY